MRINSMILIVFVTVNLIYLTCSKVNLIVNGQFQDAVCPSPTQDCTGYVTSWIPDPSIEIGSGNLYSNKLTDTQMVCDLVTEDNNCIKQIVPNLQSGKYTLQFKWVANKNTQLAGSNFDVLINNVTVISIMPKDLQISLTKIQFQNPNNNSSIQLKFCSRVAYFDPNIGHNGGILISVALYKFIIHKNQFMIIPSSKNKITIKQLNAPINGNYTLAFVQKSLHFSQKLNFNIKVLWNGIFISTLYPKKDYKNLHSFTVSAKAGINRLTFDSSHILGQIKHHILISHIFFDKNQI